MIYKFKKCEVRFMWMPPKSLALVLDLKVSGTTDSPLPSVFECVKTSPTEVRHESDQNVSSVTNKAGLENAA